MNSVDAGDVRSDAELEQERDALAGAAIGVALLLVAIAFACAALGLYAVFFVVLRRAVF